MNAAFDCPRCGETLTMSERQGIEIDYCPQCRGVWLDRGELDKILDRASGAQPTGTAAPPETGQAAGGWTAPAHPRPPSHHGGFGTPYGGAHGGKRRKGWLDELFD